MSSMDGLLWLGYMFSAWTVGFTGGYLLTKFKDAMNRAV